MASEGLMEANATGSPNRYVRDVSSGALKSKCTVARCATLLSPEAGDVLVTRKPYAATDSAIVKQTSRESNRMMHLAFYFDEHVSLF
jgi:hypothetical protein